MINQPKSKKLSTDLQSTEAHTTDQKLESIRLVAQYTRSTDQDSRSRWFGDQAQAQEPPFPQIVSEGSGTRAADAATRARAIAELLAMGNKHFSQGS